MRCYAQVRAGRAAALNNKKRRGPADQARGAPSHGGALPPPHTTTNNNTARSRRRRHPHPPTKPNHTHTHNSAEARGLAAQQFLAARLLVTHGELERGLERHPACPDVLKRWLRDEQVALAAY
jgi:hypothetical protein